MAFDVSGDRSIMRQGLWQHSACATSSRGQILGRAASDDCSAGLPLQIHGTNGTGEDRMHSISGHFDEGSVFWNHNRA